MSNSLFTLKNGAVFVVAEAAGGVYNTAQLKSICEISEEDSSFLKVTEDERLGLMIPADKIPAVQGKLAAVGLLLRDYRGANCASPKSCLGNLCPRAKQDALAAAMEISPLLNEKLADRQERISIGISGCSESCVSAATDDIRLVGHENGYKIYIGGKSTEDSTISQLLCEGVSQQKIGEVILEILNIYSQLKQENESLGDLLKRVSLEPFQKLSEATFEMGGIPEISGAEGVGELDADTTLPELESELPSELSMDESGLDSMDVGVEGEFDHFAYDESSSERSSEHKNVSMNIVEKNISMKLPSGLDLNVPLEFLKEGRSIELELGKEKIIIENSSEKMNIKVSDNKKEST